MPDGLYDRDILLWSERQSALLRRIAAGEELNEEVDWPNVIEEVETVGRSELRACEDLLNWMLINLIRLRREPHGEVTLNRRVVILEFAAQARRYFSPSMQHRIDLQSLYASALRAVRAGAEGPVNLPASCPYTLDDLLADDLDLAELVARLG